MDSFLNIFGVFDRVARLREDPLLADIYADIADLDNLRYMGPEMDRENLRRDIRSWSAGFGGAFRAAKQKAGLANA